MDEFSRRRAKIDAEIEAKEAAARAAIRRALKVSWLHRDTLFPILTILLSLAGVVLALWR